MAVTVVIYNGKEKTHQGTDKLTYEASVTL